MSDINLQKPEQPPSHFDPTDELTKDEIQQCFDKADQALEIANNKELNLMKSDITVPGQEWVLVSFVGQDCAQKTETLGMKVWGCFDTIQDAKKHADKINKLDENKIFDIFILEMYTWARIPPDPQCIDDQNYHEEQLHTLITEHKRQQLRAKEVFDLRKDKLKNNPDINQYNRNKEVIKELMGNQLDDTPNESPVAIQNKEAHQKIFGIPEPLPKLEVSLEPTQTTETKPKGTEEIEEIEEIADSEYNQKFYNQNP
jgi:hypothetical protein